MGWPCVVSGETKEYVIDSLTRDQSNEHGTWKVLAHSLRGSQLWSVVEKTLPDGKASRYIDLHLLRFEGGDWCWKDICESMWPSYYNCPMKFLKMVPVASEKWRKGVREFHAEAARRRKMVVEPGMKFELKACRIPWVEITSVIGRRIIGQYQGGRYRLQKKDLGDVMT